MKAFQVDERVDQWLGSDPAFRVTLFEPGGGSWAVDTWEVTDCGVLDAIRWAQQQVAVDGAWALGLLDTETIPGTNEVRRGFTFIEGTDLNRHEDDFSDWERRQADEMIARGSAHVVPPRSGTV